MLLLEVLVAKPRFKQRDDLQRMIFQVMRMAGTAIEKQVNSFMRQIHPNYGTLLLRYIYDLTHIVHCNLLISSILYKKERLNTSWKPRPVGYILLTLIYHQRNI